ncbi:MAG: hypothetical protein PHP92_04250 [Candidatus Nanoarchaeia archaeon]|nr:hypothetical protein [Candidatus Nanoarchaeia archaeon]
MNKRDKILLLILNILVIIINAVIQGVNVGSLKVPSWILQALVPIASAITIFVQNYNLKKQNKAING